MPNKVTPIPRMTSEQITDFVFAYCDNNIITSNNVPDNLLHLIFMPIIFIKNLDTDNLGIIYANTKLDTTIRQAINGFPIFASCQLMHKDDVPIIVDLVKQELIRRQKIKTEIKYANNFETTNLNLPGIKQKNTH